MYYYFSSSFPAVIKIDGVYLGQINTAVKTFKSEDDAEHFVEVIELSSPSNVYAFILNAEFLRSSSAKVSITDLSGGYFIKFLVKTTTDFSVIAQEKFNNCVVTVFNENGVKLSVETPYDFYYENLDFNFESVKIFTVNIFNAYFVAIEFNGNKKLLALYSLSEKICKSFFSEIDSYSFDNGFYTTFHLSDIAKHKVEINWDYSDGNFKEWQKTVTTSPNFNPETCPKEIVPYAFFEELLVGGDIKEYVGENILNNANKLKGYLGEYIGVCPPPEFKSPNQVGLIYTSAKNVYYVKYFTCEMQGGKITNVKGSD